MIKIGYQGIEGSNAEQAARDLVKKLSLQDVEFVPLVDSKPVKLTMAYAQFTTALPAWYWKPFLPQMELSFL